MPQQPLTRLWQCPACNRTSRSDRAVSGRYCAGSEFAPCGAWCDLIEDRDDEPPRHAPSFSTEAALAAVADILKGSVSS